MATMSIDARLSCLPVGRRRVNERVSHFVCPLGSYLSLSSVCHLINGDDDDRRRRRRRRLESANHERNIVTVLWRRARVKHRVSSFVAE